MKRAITCSLFLGLLLAPAPQANAADLQRHRTQAGEDGIALALVLDTSGSMKDPVADRNGQPTPKYIIAGRALEAVIDTLQAYTQGAAGGAPRKVETGLIVFQGPHAREAVPFGSFDARSLRQWVKGFTNPEGATPLGEAVTRATELVCGSNLRHKHVLVVTDGINTAGRDPSLVLPELQRRAKAAQTSVGYYFVAFDVDATVFAPLKRLGATVVAAADEPQLRAQCDFILQKKILLEDEEPPAKGGAPKP